MRKARAFFCVYAGALGLAATIVAAVMPSAGARAKLAPGDEPYSPSKLEWAAIELNGTVSTRDWGAGEAVFSRFQAGTDGVTLTCFLRYRAGATVGRPDDVREVVRGAVEHYRRARGWSWLPEAKDIAFGILLDAPGAVWLGEVTFEVGDGSVPTTGTGPGGELAAKPKNLDFEEWPGVRARAA